MEEVNVLDAQTKEHPFFYSKRSFYCFGGSILCGALVLLIAVFLDESSVLTDLLRLLGLSFFAMLGLFTLVGGYYSIQSIRKKEPQKWLTIVTVGLQLSLIFILLFSLTKVSTLDQEAPNSIPISE